jgi:prevent-host-death family protein
MDVGVRELKEHLSEYLDRASRGEVIRVTDRGRPRAILGPIPGVSRLEDGIREGWIRPGSGAPPRALVRQTAVAPVLATLDEDRGV